MHREIEDARLDEGGLQRERTSLAWRRTGLALVVAFVLIARVGSDTPQSTLLGTIALMAAALAPLVWVSTRHIYRRAAVMTALCVTLSAGELWWILRG